jgi:hypothetical protein
MNTPYLHSVTNLAKIQKIISIDTNKYTSNAAVVSMVDDPDIVIVIFPGGVKSNGFAIDETGQLTATLLPNSLLWLWSIILLQLQCGVVILDPPTQFYATGFPVRFRHSTERATIVHDLLNQTQQLFPKSKIVAYGHSYGGIDIANLAMNGNLILKKVAIGNGTWLDVPRKNILHNGGHIKDFNSAMVKIPTLILHHINDQNDRCIYDAVKHHTEHVNSIIVSGGIPHIGSPVDDPGPHYWTTQEYSVLKELVNWFRDKPYQKIIE